MVSDRDRRYRQAGWAYVILGLVVILVTVWTPELTRPERREDWIHLLAAFPFVLLFGLVLWFGHRLHRGLQAVIAILLTVSALGRTVVFTGNALGHRPRLRESAPYFRLETVDPEPRMWLAAFLTAWIFAMLLRAWWPRRGAKIFSYESPRSR